MSSDAFFRMTVKDVFSIAKRGTVVTGTVEAGSLKTGDEVLIRGQGGEKKALVTGIESFRKTIGQANAGDNIGVLLKDLNKTDVAPGDVLVGSGSEFSWNP